MVGHHEHEAIAMQKTEICCLPVATVNELSKDNPILHKELLLRWLAIAQRRLRFEEAVRRRERGFILPL